VDFEVPRSLVCAEFRREPLAARASTQRLLRMLVLYEAVSQWLRSAWPFAAISYAPR
jgi:hypothetical protein